MPAPDTAAVKLDAAWCRAISQPGTQVNVYGILGGFPVLTKATPGRWFACTQDAGHEGRHQACDGHGHVLARWPRKDPEQYWQHGDREDHGHART